MTMPRAVLLGALVLTCDTVAAHGGRLDANGCHHDRKHGGYHRGNAPRTPPANFAPTTNQRLTGDGNNSTYCANCRAAARRVRRGCGVAIPGMGPIWIGMGMGWGVSR